MGRGEKQSPTAERPHNVNCDGLNTHEKNQKKPTRKELLSPRLNPGYTPSRHPRERRRKKKPDAVVRSSADENDMITHG